MYLQKMPFDIMHILSFISAPCHSQNQLLSNVQCAAEDRPGTAVFQSLTLDGLLLISLVVATYQQSTDMLLCWSVGFGWSYIFMYWRCIYGLAK